MNTTKCPECGHPDHPYECAKYRRLSENVTEYHQAHCWKFTEDREWLGCEYGMDNCPMKPPGNLDHLDDIHAELSDRGHLASDHKELRIESEIKGLKWSVGESAERIRERIAFLTAELATLDGERPKETIYNVAGNSEILGEV